MKIVKLPTVSYFGDNSTIAYIEGEEIWLFNRSGRCWDPMCNQDDYEMVKNASKDAHEANRLEVMLFTGMTIDDILTECS